MKKLLAGVATATVLASTALAGNPNTGCGLGYVLWQSALNVDDSSVVVQVLEGTTNGISWSQTFGITFGISGCRKPASFANNDQVQNYVASNLDALMADSATGHGDSIDGLAKLINVDVDKLGADLYANYDKVFPSQTVAYADVVDSIASIEVR